MRRLSWLTWAAACCGIAACGDPKTDAPAPPSAAIVATVGERTISREALDAYLGAAIGPAEEPEQAGAEVRSRLLDQLIDEEMILGEAMRQDLTLSDEEKRDALPPDAQEAAGSGLERVLLQRKFKRDVILDGVAVAPEEVEAYFASHLAEFRQPARAVLRKVLLDDRKTAEQVRAHLAARPADFEEIASARSLAPDGGRPYSHEEELLPEALRDQIGRMEPGMLSPVIEDLEGFYILRLEGRQAASAPDLEQVRGEIELKLLTERSERRYQEFLARLRERTPVTIREELLPFSYVRKP